MALPDPIEDYRFYHPGCFRQLRMALEAMQQLARAKQALELWQSLLNERPRPAFMALLHAMDMDNALEHASRQSRDSGQFARQLSTWFDAFRTRQFVHGIRDHYHPSIGLRELLTRADFLGPLPGMETLQVADQCTRPDLALTRFNRHLLQAEDRRALGFRESYSNDLPE